MTALQSLRRLDSKRLRFNRVTTMNLMSLFLEHGVYNISIRLKFIINTNSNMTYDSNLHSPKVLF